MLLEEQEIHLRDYLKVIQKRKSTVLLFFILTVFVVVIVTFNMTPIYEASIQVLVEKNENPSLVGNYYYNSYDPEFFATQEQLIKSQNVARKVVELLSLEETYDSFFPEKTSQQPSFIKGIGQVVGDFLTGLMAADDSAGPEQEEELNQRSRADVIADAIRAGIIVKPVKESRIINISFRSENPEFASLIANTIADAYQEEVMSIQHHSSGYALQWMTKKANEEKEKLARAEKKLQEYMQKNDIVTIEDRVAIIPQKLTNLTQKLAEAEAQRKKLEGVYEQIKTLKEKGGDLETLPVFANHAGLQTQREQIRKAEQHILELKQKYGPKHPVMLEAFAELREQKAKKEQEIQKIIELVRNEYEMARAEEENMRTALAKVKQEVMLLNEKMTEYRILKRDVESNRVLYDALLMRIKEKGVSEKTLKVNVWTTQKAEIPTVPVKPNKKRNILLAIILGLFGGVGLAFFLEYLDNTVKDPEEVEKRFGVSVLGVVEMLKKDHNPDLMLLEEPSSSFSESFKSLRTAVLLSSAESPPKQVLITSMSPGEGKTTTAVNLAVAISQTERSVLLIDTDLRKPRVHKALGLSNRKGLSSLLSGMEAENILIKHPESGLTVLPAGPVPPNPAELLGSRKFAQVMEALAKRFDTIILDSSPMLSATDSLLVSKQVDGTIIVCRYGIATNDMLKQGIKSLDEIQSNVLGVVLNAIELKHSKYYSYYGYYQYAYKAEEE